MRSRVYTVKLPTDGLTPIDIPVEGPFAAAVGAVSAPSVVGVDGFFAEWRNRPLRCPNKFSQGAAQFIPRFRLGFSLSAALAAAPPTGPGSTSPLRLVASGVALAVGVGATVAVGPFAAASLTSRLVVLMRVVDANAIGLFTYGPGPLEIVLGAHPPNFVSASLTTQAAGTVGLSITNDDAAVHDVAWAIAEVPLGVVPTGGATLPALLCSQSLVGNVLATSAGAVTPGDGTFADPGGKPTIRVANGMDVAGLLLRVDLGVAEASDEDRA
jgi:hypothetical protein